MSYLTTSQIEQFKKLCHNGAYIECTYMGHKEKGKVIGREFMGGVKIQGVLTHVISDQALSSNSGYYSRLVVDGKKIIDNDKVMI
jgi:hypothetical protein